MSDGAPITPMSNGTPGLTRHLTRSRCAKVAMPENGHCGMTTAHLVKEYLKNQDFPTTRCDFRHPKDIQAIKGGTTNYTYRLTYTATGERPVSSAVLKYAAEYATNDPTTPFSSERQIYEAHAMRELADAMKSRPEAEGCIVKVPTLHHFDVASHVMIMEDISPAPPPDAPGSASLYIFLENMCQNPIGRNGVELMRLLGDQLGNYLYRLHALTLDPSEPVSRNLRSLFLPNSMSKEIDVQTCFRDVPDKLEQYGIRLSADEDAKLAKIMADLDRDYMETPESVIMGNRFFGNIILELAGGERKKTLKSISIIDWEFAACGPCYVDLAHYLSEIWLQDRFFPGPSLGALVNQEAAVATFKAYIKARGSIDPRRLACYVGGHAACFLQFMDWNDHDGVKEAVAREGAIMMLNADAADWDEIGRNSPFMGKILELIV